MCMLVSDAFYCATLFFILAPSIFVSLLFRLQFPTAPISPLLKGLCSRPSLLSLTCHSPTFGPAFYARRSPHSDPFVPARTPPPQLSLFLSSLPPYPSPAAALSSSFIRALSLSSTSSLPCSSYILPPPESPKSVRTTTRLSARALSIRELLPSTSPLFYPFVGPGTAWSRYEAGVLDFIGSAPCMVTSGWGEKFGRPAGECEGDWSADVCVRKQEIAV
jgi:hypothetical protein